ncbi:MAG: 30S ribosome-binding factor RbfA [Deferribacteraceae bacterium]|nr:30S ribosome-binding factor RbfA [Deferribacteraceae bacterium]
MKDTKDIRIRRVAELIKQEVANIIEREVKDPRVRGVVLTYVRLNRDLSEAFIFYDTYNKNNLKSIDAGLTATVGFIRRTLKTRLSLKRIPAITFQKDETEETARRTDELLEQIKLEDISRKERSAP